MRRRILCALRSPMPSWVTLLLILAFATFGSAGFYQSIRIPITGSLTNAGNTDLSGIPRCNGASCAVTNADNNFSSNQTFFGSISSAKRDYAFTLENGIGGARQTVIGSQPSVVVSGIHADVLHVSAAGVVDALAIDGKGDAGLAGALHVGKSRYGPEEATINGPVMSSLGGTAAVVPPVFAANGMALGQASHAAFGSCRITRGSSQQCSVNFYGPARFESASSYACAATAQNATDGIQRYTTIATSGWHVVVDASSAPASDVGVGVSVLCVGD